MTLLDPLRAADLFVLDRVFTPFAHFLHDALDVKSRTLAIVSLILDAALQFHIGGHLWVMLLGVPGPVVVIASLRRIPEPRMNFANPLRSIWAPVRIFNMLAFPPLLIMADSLQQCLSGVAWISGWWLASVTDRPRKPLTMLSPALLPEGAAS